MVVGDLNKPACVLTSNKRKASLPATANFLSTTKVEAAEDTQHTHLEEILASPGTPMHSLISDEVVNDKLTLNNNLGDNQSKRLHLK